jgi:molybdopterin-containing oxidoreductase family iron-sulfur binding subunit
MGEGMNRRRFLTVLGVTGGGAAALGACGVGAEPTKKLIPYLVQPEDQIPGTAPVCDDLSRMRGRLRVHAKVREGRVIKLEGNPESPVNRGHLCARGQAALQGVYNPDRVTDPLARNAQGVLEKVSWEDALGHLGAKVKAAHGKGIVFVTGHEAGSFGDLVDEWIQTVGGKHVTYEPFAFEALREGNRIAFGTGAIPSYDLANAKYILSFGADFLDTWLSPVGYQGAFAQSHGFNGRHDGGMAKFVFVGPRMSLTAMNADEWIAPAPGTEGLLALALAEVIVGERLGAAVDLGRVKDLLARHTPQAVAHAVGIDAAAIEHLAREFAESKGGVAVAGGMAAHYPNGAEIVAAVNILNYVVGAVGKTVVFGPNQTLDAVSPFKQMADVVADMQGARWRCSRARRESRHSLGGGFWQAGQGRLQGQLSYLDETASAADLVLPDLHPLEQWNDSRPRAGVFALQQPVMQPVFPNTRQTGDVLLTLAGKSDTFKDYLQGRWKSVHARYGRGKGFDAFWTEAVQHGGVYGDAPAQSVRLAADAARIMAGTPAEPAFEGKAGDPVLVAFPSMALHDGRGANKSWLQELPDPVSKIAWHAWVEVHPDTAAKWSVTDGDFLMLQSPHGSVRAPVAVTLGIRPDVIAIPTGQGHTAYGRYAQIDHSTRSICSAGANAYGGRTFAVRVSTQRTGGHRFLATSSGDPRGFGPGDGIVKVLPLAEAVKLHPGEHEKEEEAPEYSAAALEGWAESQHKKATLGDYAGRHPRWGMAIDLAKCTGCSACVTACYAENNLATVGEDLFLRHRQMSWLRIERYWRGGEHGEPVRGVVSPMLCQQCEMAPCEPVCPVFAAYHTPAGLNAQVYNRCVGTRYCANNCPYKVRYFNWYDFAEVGGEHEAWPSPLEWQLNPDVTVREKGVMEKCTFCVQRIRGAQHQARLGDRPVQDGEITPACAQSCPSDAIVFGDLHDKTSRVAQLSEDPRGYHVFEALNTKPAVTYLARVVHEQEA